MISAEIDTQYGLMRSSLTLLAESMKGRIQAEINHLDPVSVTARIKESDSLQQKLQTGKYPSLKSIEDLVALTVVTKTRRDMVACFEAIRDSGLQIVRQELARAVKPSDFSYREPKIICVPNAGYLDRNPDMAGIFVEVQFTTALQHALDQATHDFDYKGHDYQWGKFRLVAQLRGMLELVDNMIDDPERSAPLASTSALVPAQFEVALDVLAFLTSHFDQDSFPADVKRLVDTVASWLASADLKVEDLEAAFDKYYVANLRSFSIADHVLGILTMSYGDKLLGGFAGAFLVDRELADHYPAVENIPNDRRVALTEPLLGRIV
jgi:ppGpp synthetase/RelA/SpoT-type nucleotidyltranferase